MNAIKENQIHLTKIFKELLETPFPNINLEEIQFFETFIKSKIQLAKTIQKKIFYDKNQENNSDQVEVYLEGSHSVGEIREKQENPKQNKEKNENDYSVELQLLKSPKLEFQNFIKLNKTYLKLKKQKCPFSGELSNEKFSYPLSVVYDEFRCDWFICERDEQKILRINVGNDIEMRGVSAIESQTLRNPSACIIYNEGESIAILCSEKPKSNYMILVYNLNTKMTTIVVSYSQPIYQINSQLRGLAKSFAGNFLSLDSNRIVRRLRIFKCNVGAKDFILPKSVNPSFLASINDKVAISDLGSRSVFLLKVNDTNWDNVTFNILNVIQEEFKPANEMCDLKGFLYPAGLQFDVNEMLLIGDAKGHSIKLFGLNLEFYHRLSSDFAIPYMSSFFVNSKGEMILLDIRSTTSSKFIFCQLTSTHEVCKWNPSKSF